MYGYEILNIFEQKGWRPSTGTLYPALKKLEAKGFIESFQSDPTRGAKDRSNYKLTKKGFDFVQDTYHITIQHPELYIQPFIETWNEFLPIILKTKVLVLDFLNFINPQSVFRTIFPNEPPSNVKFEKVYDFNLDNPKAKVYDSILLFLPFSFTYREIADNPVPEHLKVLEDVKSALKPGGRLFVIDLFWTKHAIIDILSFMATGEVTQIAYTEKEMQELLILAGYQNVHVLQKHRGVIILIAENIEE